MLGTKGGPSRTQHCSLLLESANDTPLSGWGCTARIGRVGYGPLVSSTHLVGGGFLPLVITSETGEREGQNERDHDEGPDRTSTICKAGERAWTNQLIQANAIVELTMFTK